MIERVKFTRCVVTYDVGRTIKIVGQAKMIAALLAALFGLQVSGHAQIGRSGKETGIVPLMTLKDANRPLLSHDGRRMCVLPEIGVIEIYDVPTKRLLQTFRPPDARDCVISADGEEVLIAGYVITESDGRHYRGKPVYYLYNITSSTELRRFETAIVENGVRIGGLGFGSDGGQPSKNVSADLRLTANISDRKRGEQEIPSVILASTETQQLVREFNLTGMPKLGIVGKTVLTPDARFLATTRRDNYQPDPKNNQTVVWDAKTGRELLRLPFFCEWLSISGNGKYLATTTSTGDNYITEVWDIATGKRVSRISDKIGSETAYKIRGLLSPDGKLLATTGMHYVLLWNTETGQLGAAQQIAKSRENDIVKAVSFSGDGQYIAISTDTEVTKVWRVSALIADAKAH